MGQRCRVHSSYIWLGGLRAAFYVFVAIIVSFASSIPSLIELAQEISSGNIDGISEGALLTLCILGLLFVVVAVIGLSMAGRAWGWKHLWYELGDDEFSLYSGIFNKKHVHVPYSRVQSVDQKASLIQRIVGVCSVSVDTAGGSANKAIMVPYVTRGDAERLRAQLFARKQVALGYEQPMQGGSDGNILDAPDELMRQAGDLFGGPSLDTGAVSYEYGLSNKELVLTGLSNNMSVAVIVLGIIAVIGQLFGTAEGFAPWIGEYAASGASTVIDDVGPVAFGIIITALLLIAALVLWAFSAIGTCVAYGGFRARRRDDRIEVERGLLSRQFQGVSVDRVQTVIVRQSLFRRLIGYCELSLGKIDAMGNNGENDSSNKASDGIVVHPFLKIDRVQEVMSGLIPEFADVPQDLRKVPPVALRRAILRRCLWQGGGFWLAVFSALCQAALLFLAQDREFSDMAEMLLPACWVMYALAAVLFAMDLIGAIFWARESFFAMNRRFMLIRNGGLRREAALFPRNKIQFGYSRTNPLQKAASTSTIIAVSASGVGHTSIKLVDVSSQDADRWLAWLQPYRP